VRRRAVVGAILLAVIGLIAYLLTPSGSHKSGPVAAGAGGKGAATTSTSPPRPPVFHLVPANWQLPAPLSRAVALPAGSSLRLLGGLSSGNTTTPAIATIDPQTGQSSQLGTLGQPVHDAAGAVIGGRDVVFGGGAATVGSAVQVFANGTASSLSRLPAPRADLAAATVGNRVVLVGGYDGVTPSADIWETTDGVNFTVLAQLPQPVRYPAVAAMGEKVYVIGGSLAGGSEATADIQVIDVAHRTATIAGQLPAALSDASAAVVGGGLYVFGGRSGGHAVDAVWKLDPVTLAPTLAARLPVATSQIAVATVGATTYLVGGENDAGQPVRSVAAASMVPAPPAGASPFSGRLLIADRGNNRLLLVSAQKQVLWTFPSPTAPAPAQGFYFPDDAFFAKAGTAIITNQEDQDTIIEISFPDGKVIGSYGHPNQPGSAPGYLDQPDDAYLLKGGTVTVADAKNCRIVFLNANFTYASEIGSDHRCVHNPPRDIAYPNGDTPLSDGNVLISEIYGSYVDEIQPDGTVVWSLQLPIAYPSDPQQIGPDLYLIADYSRPGGLYEFTREGTIVWSYTFASGDAMLDHPSLAEMLPNGLICVNDDYRHRVVLIDPMTKTIVWKYGQDDVKGTGPGLLNTPDGFDLLAPDNTTPTHPQTG
jgi:N-acetylneuraminic acid mutarotase